MIFGTEMVEAIVSGRKTQTRRPVTLVPNLAPDGWDGRCDGMVAMPCRYAVGKSYAVQPGRGKRGVARIVLDEIEQQVLREITEEDARAEGFPNRNAFLNYWHNLYVLRPQRQRSSAPVWVLRFHLQAEQKAAA